MDKHSEKKSRSLVEPEALAALEQMPRFHFTREGLPAIRATIERLMAERPKNPPTPGVLSRRTIAGGDNDSPEVPVTIFAPVGGLKVRAALLYIHGGGYFTGSVAADQPECEWLVSEIGCCVVAVEYRLAPETPHPGPVSDCYTALTWIYKNADALGIDRTRIGIYGGSAGGGLAAALALLARDRKEILLRMQCLVSPMLDDCTSLGTDLNPYAGEYIWTIADNRFGWEALLGHEAGRPGVSPYASPARAVDLSGLPPTYLWVGALDLFVDEGIAYAHRLIRAGVPTELHIYPGVTHGNMLVAEAPSTSVMHEGTLRALKRALC